MLTDKALERVVARDLNVDKRAAAAIVWAAMKAKTKIGMGIKAKTRKRKTTTKKRIFLSVKRSSVLSILPMFGALGSLIEGTACKSGKRH